MKPVVNSFPVTGTVPVVPWMIGKDRDVGVLVCLLSGGYLCRDLDHDTCVYIQNRPQKNHGSVVLKSLHRRPCSDEGLSIREGMDDVDNRMRAQGRQTRKPPER